MNLETVAVLMSGIVLGIAISLELRLWSSFFGYKNRFSKKTDSNFDRVMEFHLKFGHPVSFKPHFPHENVETLRMSLIKEELNELEISLSDRNLVEVADALTDLLYLVYGMGHVYGIDLDECFKEVHRSNMSKLVANGKPVVRKDGKIEKGPNYTPPQLHKILFPEG